MSRHEPRYKIIDREENGLPKLVTAAILDRSDHLDLEFLVVARIPYEARPNGLPVANAFHKATTLEEKLTEALREFGLLHIGHVTHRGSMKVLFRSASNAPQEIRVRTGLLRSEPLFLDSQHDPDWSVSDQDMRITPYEEMKAANRDLLQKLAEHGDRAEKLRQVEFAAFFPSPQARSMFLTEAQVDGFTMLKTWDHLEQPAQYWCDLAKDSTIEPGPIAARCLEVKRIAARHGGEFDGWQSPITR